MVDGIGRTIDYLRISVTDKCNLRCQYCMPKEGVKRLPHDMLLRLEEIYRVVLVMADLGVKKVRFTGGEPLVRKNLVKLISDVRRISGIEEITLTTNGILLKEMAYELKEAGVDRVNVSLDTCDEKTFADITGYDGYQQVREGIVAAKAAGMGVKINCVPCLELNGGDLENMALLAKNDGIDVRFIELMPVGCGKYFHGIPSDEVLDRLSARFGRPVPCMEKRGNGPASYYEFDGFCGKIGVISPMSHKFCKNCNRVRLTAEGQLKLCLHFNSGIDLKPLLLQGAGDEEIKTVICEAMMKKPASHDFENMQGGGENDTRKMVQIGG